MVRHLSGLCTGALFLLFSCSASPNNEKGRQLFPQPPNSPQYPRLLLPEREVEPETRALVLEAETINELIPVTQIIRLESHSKAWLSDVSAMAVSGNQIALLDALSEQILVFDSRGIFQHPLGKTGEGPGEYGYPRHIQALQDGGFAVLDGHRGHILLYNAQGTFTRKFSGQTSHGRIIPQSTFLWTPANRLYLPAFFSQNPADPWHLVLQIQGSEFQVLAGFGNRRDPMQEHELGAWSYTAFSQIDGNLWTGSPYGDQLFFFDDQGRERFAANQNQVMGNIGLTKSDIDNLPRDKKEAKKQLRQWFRDRAGISKILDAGPVILVQCGFNYDIYSRNGERLATQLQRDRLLPFFTAHQGNLYTVIWPMGSSQHINDADYAAMLAIGYDPKQDRTENPYIRIGRWPNTTPERGEP